MPEDYERSAFEDEEKMSVIQTSEDNLLGKRTKPEMKGPIDAYFTPNKR